MGRKAKADGGGGAPAWMATFADMMSLLLTFFVLLLSFAEMDIVKFRDALGSINSALGFMQSSGTSIMQQSSAPAVFKNPIATSTSQQSSKSETSNEQILDELAQMIDDNDLGKDLEIEDSDRGPILRVQGKMFFTPGTAELKYQSYPVLEKVSELLKKFPNRVSIEGHTDNIPIRGGRYSSNWELSTARAYAALKFLKESAAIDLTRINIAGFGDTHPIAPNDTPEGRGKNRRVEFVFYESQGN